MAIELKRVKKRYSYQVNYYQCNTKVHIRKVQKTTTPHHCCAKNVLVCRSQREVLK